MQSRDFALGELSSIGRSGFGVQRCLGIDLVHTQHYVRKAGRPSLLLPVSSASRKQMVLGALIFILGVFGSIYLTCQIKHEFFNIMRDDTWVN